MIQRGVFIRLTQPAALWRAAANTATLSVLAAGLLTLAARPDLPMALILLALATGLDGVDGALARRAGGPSLGGAVLDLAADLAAFGLAPAAIVLSQSRRSDWVLGIALTIFLAAALGRLLRTCRHYRQPNPVGYIGHPMPACGWALVGLSLIISDARVLALAIVALSGLAVCRRAYPSPRWMWRHARLPSGLVVAAALVAAPFSGVAALLVLSASYALIPLMVPLDSRHSSAAA
jgi:CDP-diacylglycerol---serine O-phosphatidyltransferase